MAFYSSLRQVFVTNSPALLAQGKTVDSLAVGQIGVLDAKTYKAVTAPTYAKNKALKVVWGTPDLNVGEFGGVPNENEYTKLIKGKHIISFQANKAKRGVTPLYTIGWSGDAADTDTLFTTAGVSKNLYIKVTGDAIDRLHTKQGIIKYFNTTPEVTSDCDDPCAVVDCAKFTKELVAQINRDKDLNPYIRASAIIECTTTEPIVESDCYKFRLNVCDTGDDYALGLVQSQYPDEDVVRIARNGAISTYGVVKDANTAPAAYTSSAISVPECPVCPAGATLVAEANVFEFKVVHGSTAPAPTGVVGTAVLLSSDPAFDVYKVHVAKTEEIDDVIAGATADQAVSFIGESRNICQLPATTIAWAANGTLKKRDKKYRITLADDICGNNRLADLQAAYPELVVSVVNATGECVHTYETTVKSNCYEVGCSIGDIRFVAPAMFEGVEWKSVAPATADEGCKCGILIETAFVNRSTGACSFNSFPYENDVVHVQISNYNPDYNAETTEKSWAVKQIRQVQYPAGHGAEVRMLEKDSKMYDQRFPHHDPVVTEIQGYSLQANPAIYYDQYILNFRTIWKTGAGWAEEYTQTIDLMIFVPEGTGSQIEKALAGYVSSAGVEEDFESIV